MCFHHRGGDGGVEDGSTPPTDTGTPPADTGTPPTDTGTPPADTGTPPADTGAMCVDAEGDWENVNGCELVGLAPGEAVFIDLEGTIHRRKLVDKPHSPCLFEWVYFARPDSFLDRVSVYKTRLRLGELMAPIFQETGWEVDVVIPVPESAVTSAMAMARALKVKYREGLVKNRYVGRTFIMANDNLRRKSIRQKLNPIQLEFEGNQFVAMGADTNGATAGFTVWVHQADLHPFLAFSALAVDHTGQWSEQGQPEGPPVEGRLHLPND